MNNAGKVLAIIAIATLSGHAVGQVYETKDEEGHPVFSDEPSQGAVEVRVDPANRADSVEPGPAVTEHPEADATPAPPARGSAEYEQKIEREMEAYRREEAERERERHSETRHEVGHDASEKRHEVGHDASEQRHEVGHDASERRREVGAARRQP